MGDYQRGPSIARDGISVDDSFYRPWFKVDHVDEMPGSEAVLTVQDVTEEPTYIPGEGKTLKPSVWFIEHQRCLILNKTRGDQAKEVMQSKTYSDWVGKQLCIYIDRAVRNPKTKKDGPALRVKAPPFASIERAKVIDFQGETFYMDTWAERKSQLVNFYTGERTTDYSKMYESEVKAMTAMLEERIEQFGTVVEWEASQSSQPQPQPQEEEEADDEEYDL